MTEKMRAIWRFYRDFWKENQYGPSFREVADALGKNNTSSIHRTVTRMISRGYLKKMAGEGKTTHRAIAIGPVNPGEQPKKAPEKKGPEPDPWE